MSTAQIDADEPTDVLRETMRRAFQLALSSRHGSVTGAHFVATILDEPDIARMLREARVDPLAVRDVVTELVIDQPRRRLLRHGVPPLSDALEEALDATGDDHSDSLTAVLTHLLENGPPELTEPLVEVGLTSEVLEEG